MKKILSLMFIGFSLIACNLLNFSNAPEIRTITGTVVQNVMQVPVDGNNYLIVDTENGRINILYQEGGLVTPEMAAQQCNDNQEVAQSAQMIQAGDTVEIYGAVYIEPYALEVCSNPEFYIAVLTDNEVLGGTRTVTGTITQVITTCVVDGICAYLVETETGEQVTVIWSQGDSPNCSNNPFPINEQINTFEPENTSIEAFGLMVDANTISVCGDESYYIAFLGDDMSNDDAQGTRQVTGGVVALISDCAFDGNCAYVIQTDGGEQVTVIWAEGMSPICQNDPFQGGDTNIDVGDSIDAFGRVIDANTMSACGDPSYYITKTS